MRRIRPDRFLRILRCDGRNRPARWIHACSDERLLRYDRALGADHCRVFAARIEDRVVAWSIVTVNGTHAVRYYAGMRNEVMRLHVTDKLLYSECCILGSQGITEYDLMGIGSDFAPSLKGLNEFKCKFTEEITSVAPPATYPSRRSSTRRCRLCRACARHYANTTPLPLVGAVERSETEGGLSRWTTLCHLWRQFLPAGTIHLSFEFLVTTLLRRRLAWLRRRARRQSTWCVAGE